MGKGVHSEALSQSLNIPHHSTGDILRRAVEEETKAGLEAAEYMRQHLLVPDEILADIVQDVIHNSDGFILDGYPRNHQQVKFFFEIMRTESLQLTKVIHLVAPEKVVVQRMLGRGRVGETEEAILKRINVYKEETFPILEMFPLDKLLTIESVGGIDEVNDKIISLLALSL